jgi:hypothetical protein
MFRRALRMLLASSLGLALWAIASPAWAAPAPFCDDRGASALAPPPLLEATDVAVLRASARATCPGEELLLGASLTRGHGGSVPMADGPEPTLPSAAVPIAPSEGETMDVPPSVTRPADGVRSRIERPPRG